MIRFYQFISARSVLGIGYCWFI